jgi:hypothetical protein
MALEKACRKGELEPNGFTGQRRIVQPRSRDMVEEARKKGESWLWLCLKLDIAVVGYGVLGLKPVKDSHAVKLHKRNNVVAGGAWR